jgi:hypothetical protein
MVILLTNAGGIQLTTTNTTLLFKKERVSSLKTKQKAKGNQKEREKDQAKAAREKEAGAMAASQQRTSQVLIQPTTQKNSSGKRGIAPSKSKKR